MEVTANPITIAHETQTRSITNTTSPWQSPPVAHCPSNTSSLEQKYMGREVRMESGSSIKPIVVKISELFQILQKLIWPPSFWIEPM